MGRQVDPDMGVSGEAWRPVTTGEQVEDKRTEPRRWDFRRLRVGHGLTVWDWSPGAPVRVVGYGPDAGGRIAQGDEVLLDWSAAGGPPAVVMDVATVHYNERVPHRFGATLRAPRVLEDAPPVEREDGTDYFAPFWPVPEMD